MNKIITPAAPIIELNNLKNNSVVGDAERRNAAVDKAIWALRKQIPSEPEERPDRLINSVNVCNNCEHEVYSYEEYCSTCGQALDWGENR